MDSISSGGKRKASSSFSSLELSYSGRRETNHALAYFGEAFINGPELVQLALEILNFDFEAEEKQVVTRIKKLLEKYDNLDLAIDKEVFVSMLKEYQAKVDRSICLPCMRRLIRFTTGTFRPMWILCMPRPK